MADTADSRLGAFLQARRAQVTPEQAGVPDWGRRRVTGLRREEVALLAGVSAPYYARLEQGRDRRPSPEVLDAIAGALRLDPTSQQHLHELAAVAPGSPTESTREVVRDELVRLLDRHVDTPAYVLGRHGDVLAANALAQALHVSFRPGRNFIADVFLDDAARAGFHAEDLESTMVHAVALLHASEGPNADEQRLRVLVDELNAGSEEFRRLWPRHDVRRMTSGAKRFAHPVLGDIHLAYDAFTVRGAEDQMLVVCHAAPGSADELGLARLVAPAAATAP
jgi:transcriptional regulator with XRE-family HTH domain